jgi:hypothetical protein
VHYAADGGGTPYAISNYTTINPQAPDTATRLVASSESASQAGVAGALVHTGAEQLPPLQLVNSPQVTLDYAVRNAGPSGIGKVDLWMTKDDGRTWQWFADDPDLKPPITVDLPGEGLYGFRLVVQSRAGLSKRPPTPGDLPEMRIELDTTPPEAQLYAPQSEPRQRDTLILSWRAVDRNLVTNPITLQWAEQRDGAWQVIGENLGNVRSPAGMELPAKATGSFAWRLPPNVPPRVFLRLAVRDSAGNTSVAETSEPVLIDLKEPEGRLLGIVPSARQP